MEKFLVKLPFAKFPRTVTAKVRAQKLVANTQATFTKMIKSNVVLSALIRKTQIRL